MTVFEVLLPAFVAGLILTGMLAYLGVHVVERGVTLGAFRRQRDLDGAVDLSRRRWKV